jgi:prepilin peptidase CpaA
LISIPVTAIVRKEPSVHHVQALPIIVVLLAALITTVTDVWRFKVYNGLTLPLLLGGLIYHAVVGGMNGLGGSLLGAAFGFGVLLGFYIMGGMGAGDVKLMAAMGAWLGLPLTFHLFIASSLAAGVYSVILLIASQSMVETWTNLQILWLRLVVLSRHLGSGQRVEAAVKQPNRRLRVVPFAAMLMIGMIGILVWYRIKPLP